MTNLERKLIPNFFGQSASYNLLYKKISLIAHTKAVNLVELSALSLRVELLTWAALAPRLCVTFVPSPTGFYIKNSVRQEAQRPLRFSQVDEGEPESSSSWVHAPDKHKEMLMAKS